jgi:hypothetical protein
LLSSGRSFRVENMRTRTFSRPTFPLVTGIVFFGLSRIAAAQTCNASNDPSIAIIRAAELRFGQLIPTASAGTAVITAATGSRSVTGGVVAAGGAFNAGSFNVLLCGPAGPKRFDVILPAGSVTIAGPGAATMTVSNFTVSPTGSIGASTSSATLFFVGGTLQVGANQAAGFYTGTFNVTVARQ